MVVEDTVMVSAHQPAVIHQPPQVLETSFISALSGDKNDVETEAEDDGEDTAGAEGAEGARAAGAAPHHQLCEIPPQGAVLPPPLTIIARSAPGTIYFVSEDKWCSLWASDQRSELYQSDAIAALRHGWDAQLVLLTHTKGSHRSTGQSGSPHPNFEFIFPTGDGFGIQMNEYPPCRQDKPPYRRHNAIFNALCYGQKQGLLTRRRWRHRSAASAVQPISTFVPKGKPFFDSAEAASVQLARIITQHTNYQTLYELEIDSAMHKSMEAAGACNCPQCITLVAFRAVQEAVHKMHYPEVIQRSGVALVADMCIAVAHRLTEAVDGESRTLLPTGKKFSPLYPAANTAIAHAVQTYFLSWNHNLRLNPMTFECPGNGKALCPHRHLFTKLGLWQTVIRIERDDARIPDDLRLKHATNWLQRDHFPLTFETLMKRLHIWLAEFEQTLEPGQNLDDLLKASIPFNTFIFWLTGSSNALFDVPVEGEMGMATLKSNIAFRCFPAALSAKQYPGGTIPPRCHRHWAVSSPPTLFTTDGKLTKVAMTWLIMSEAATWKADDVTMNP